MTTIYFPRHQRAFLTTGEGVGSHPQFRHLQRPPEGYRFDSTPIGWLPWLSQLPVQSWRLWRRWLELRRLSRSAGVSPLETARFVKTRGLSRIVPAPRGSAASFLPTYPLTHLTEDWFLEIEDTTTVFDPYALNGRTRDVQFRDLKVFPLIRDLLESPRCLGVLTHVKSTRDGMARLFESDAITRKTEFLPVPYLPLAPVSEEDLDVLRTSERVRFFFNNSWHQGANNFFLRGGVSILECFERVLERNYPVALVLRSALPAELRERFASLLAHPNVEVMDRFLTSEEYIALLRSSSYFLLPSARLHVVSILESMYYGAVPIVSDGWGIQEYVEDAVTGHVVPGVYGKVCWVDAETGALREDYAPMYQSPGIVTDALFRQVTELLDGSGPANRPAIALRAHRRVREHHDIEGFNVGFGRFLERGLLAR